MQQKNEDGILIACIPSNPGWSFFPTPRFLFFSYVSPIRLERMLGNQPSDRRKNLIRDNRILVLKIVAELKIWVGMIPLELCQFKKRLVS